MSRRRGFTLIEIMVVMGIVAFLAAIAIPLYYTFQLRSKRSQSKVMFSAIRTSQVAFRGANDEFAPIAVPEPLAIPDFVAVPWPRVPCPAACSRTSPLDCTTFSCIGFQMNGNTYFQANSPRGLSASGIDEFAIGLVGNIDGTGVPGSLAFRSGYDITSPLGNFGDGITACPANVPVDDLVDCTPFDY